ncbi:glycosyltransferase family 2 protein [Priestia taiwanensis]|uniref:Glycosyltransferase 2-like domain-containing protein n=1 Tax=Priestia taiwanensis TaxID=1347902 RepID=A0A917EQ66_9BACI|nr:glycosyltransferase family 2 protein [Priestia taiwanensis]MBM7364122.1 glycosyltransferase involved in cell wall biosynthesis [Priestia taiwanensis]GGE71744.1 hypothetical protein GCM10007140_22160 [Priestia taiwanensis]
MKESGLPLVSILIPTYNRPALLQEALESAIDQTYPHTEIVISDDSTNDETERLIREYYAPYYPHIRYKKQPKTLGGLRNNQFLLEEATGECVNYLMDDDLFAPTKIERMMAFFLEDKEVKLVTSHRQCFFGSGMHRLMTSTVKKHYEEDTIVDGIELGNYLLMYNHNIIGEPTTALFRKRDLHVPFGTYEGREYGCNVDKAMWLHLLRQGKAVYIADTLSYFRLHQGQQSKRQPILLKGLEDYAHEVTASYRCGFLQGDGQYKKALLKVLEYACYIGEEHGLIDNETYKGVIEAIQMEYNEVAY